MLFQRVLLHAIGLLTGLILCLSTPGVAAAQSIPLRRDVPPAVPAGCSTNARPAVPPVRSQDRQEAARLATSATHAAILGENAQARELLSRAALLDPSAENIAFLLARILDDLDEPELALREYCRFIALSGETADADEVREYVRRVAPLRRPGIPDAAVAAFANALDYYDAGQLESAEQAFSAVVRDAPEWATPVYNRGLVRAELRQREAALADFERYLALQGGSGDDRARVLGWVEQLSVVPGPRFSPATAFVSGLVPGVGHFYTKRPVMGLAFLAGAGAAVGVAVGYEATRVDCLGVPQNGVCPPDQILAEHHDRPLLVAGIAVAGALSLLSAFDAARGARRRNAEPPVIRLNPAGDAAVSVLPPAIRPAATGVDLALLRLRF